MPQCAGAAGASQPAAAISVGPAVRDALDASPPPALGLAALRGAIQAIEQGAAANLRQAYPNPPGWQPGGAAGAALGEQTVFLRNSADKLMYQLRNWRPARHAWPPRRNPPSFSALAAGIGEPVLGPLASAGRRRWLREATTLVVVLATVGRQRNYLVDTLRSLFDRGLAPVGGGHTAVVLHNAHVPPGSHPAMPEVRRVFAAHIADGRLLVVSRPDGDLPPPELRAGRRVARRWGDSRQRVVWRTKQVLDLAFLLNYTVRCVVGPPGGPSADPRDAQPAGPSAFDTGSPPAPGDLAASGCAGLHEGAPALQLRLAPRAPYVLMLEDDIQSSAGAVPRLRRWVDGVASRRVDWSFASFYNPWPIRDAELLPPAKFFGVIGQLLRMGDVPAVVEFLGRNADQSPLDWLLVDLLEKVRGGMLTHTPSLFQHLGIVSSLGGKRQESKAVDFVP